MINEQELQDAIENYWKDEERDPEYVIDAIWSIVRDFLGKSMPNNIPRHQLLDLEKKIVYLTLFCYEKLPRYNSEHGKALDFFMRIIKARWNGAETGKIYGLQEMVNRIGSIRNDHKKLRIRSEPIAILSEDGSEQFTNVTPVQSDNTNPSIPD